MRVNRAFALGRAHGPAVGLELLDGGAGVDVPEVGNYPYVHLVRGALLEEIGRVQEARAEMLLARDGARNGAERAQIEARIARIEDPKSGGSE